MYGTNLERRIFDNILYEVDSSDIPHTYPSQFFILSIEEIKTYFGDIFPVE
jgi:hypothetical protein